MEHSSNLPTFFFQNVPIRLGPEEFACPICNKTMRQKVSIQRHILTHTGDKPFSCPHCSRSFSLICNMKTHIKKYHEPKYRSWWKPWYNFKLIFYSNMEIFLLLQTYEPVKIGPNQYACPICTRIQKIRSLN